MKTGTVKTDTFSMDYCMFGRGKEALVILPGLSVQSVMGAGAAIEEAYRLLAEDFTIWLFDRRNEPPPVYSIRDMAEDTAAAIRALGLGPVCLFGASQGGMIAMELAAGHPALVRRLVLGSTAACVGPEPRALFEHWIGLAEEGEREALYFAFAEAVYPKAVFAESRDMLRGLAKTVTDEELRRFVILAKPLCTFDVLDKLEQIACPTLVIGSDDDGVVGAAASRQLAQGINNSKLHMYDGYGHAAYDLAPDYKQRLLHFFNG